MTMWDMLSECRVQGSSAMVECLETVSGAGHLIRSTQDTDTQIGDHHSLQYRVL